MENLRFFAFFGFGDDGRWDEKMVEKHVHFENRRIE